MAKNQDNRAEQIAQIFSGLMNNLIPRKAINDLAKIRMSYCRECPFKKGRRCGKCGCFLTIKTKSLNASCPENKW